MPIKTKKELINRNTYPYPKLIIKMVNKDNPASYKAVNDFLIKVIDNDSINIKSADSTALNLNPYKNFTQFLVLFFEKYSTICSLRCCRNM